MSYEDQISYVLPAQLYAIILEQTGEMPQDWDKMKSDFLKLVKCFSRI